VTAASSTAQPAYENPLMPNAKLRQMYSAMLRLRMLAARPAPLRTLPNGSGAPQQKRTRGLEACLVSPTVDLGPDDLVMDALQSPALDFLRGKSAEQVLQPGRRLRSTGTLASCGAATRIIGPPTGPDRLWAAIGAAAALKAQTARTVARDGAVLVCYMRAEDAQPAAWTKALAHVSAHKLPVLFVLLPAPRPQDSRTGRMSAVAVRAHVPGMPVDHGDAVALYRVSQEAIGHARIGGGGALIECIRYVLEGQKTPASDAIAGLGDYMLHRHVADKRWMENEAKSFARRIGLELVHPTP
jgi:TPP-dependent pyruvate/acetoin dehydrogenase alpha subunit